MDQIDTYDEEAIAKSCESLKEDVREYYSGEIEYMKDGIGEYIFGNSDRERLITAVKNWNTEICRTLSYYLKEMEEYAKEQGCEKLSDFVKEHVDPVTHLPKDTRYPASWYNLRNAICDYEDRFIYGNDHIVFLSDERGTKISERIYGKIMAHPEEYAIIELVYD